MAPEDRLAIDGGTPTREDALPFATPVIGDEEVANVTETLRSGWLTTGEQTAAFEDEIAAYVGREHAVGTTNCTSALYLAHRLLDIEGEVITTPMTFATTVSSIVLAGGTPKLVDIRPDTLTLDIDAVREAITTDTEAVVPVHYGGQATDMGALLDLADDHDFAIIEDAAHGLGGAYDGTPLGALGDVGCYSFYATKSITTSEGGMLVTDDDAAAAAARKLRLAGVDANAWDRQDREQPGWHYDVERISGKYNMTDLQAAIGLAQFEKLDSFVATRRELAAALDEALDPIPGVEPLAVRDPDEHARHLYPVLLDEEVLEMNRYEFDRALNAEGIGTSVHYIPIHRHTAFEDIERGELSTTNALADRILCLPLHPRMEQDDVADVRRAIDKITR